MVDQNGVNRGTSASTWYVPRTSLQESLRLTIIDRHARRRPFANWMKRLANLKTLHADSNNTTSQNASVTSTSPSKSRKTATIKNNPYPLSGNTEAHNGHLAFSE